MWWVAKQLADGVPYTKASWSVRIAAECNVIAYANTVLLHIALIMVFHISIHVFALMATLHKQQGKEMLQIQNVKGLNPFCKQCCMPISSSCQQPTYTTCLAGLSYPRLLILISDCFFVAAGCPCTPWCQIIFFLSLLLTDDLSLRDASNYTLRVATVTILQFLLDCSTLSCISVH